MYNIIVYIHTQVHTLCWNTHNMPSIQDGLPSFSHSHMYSDTDCTGLLLPFHSLSGIPGMLTRMSV